MRWFESDPIEFHSLPLHSIGLERAEWDAATLLVPTPTRPNELPALTSRQVAQFPLRQVAESPLGQVAESPVRQVAQWSQPSSPLPTSTTNIDEIPDSWGDLETRIASAVRVAPPIRFSSPISEQPSRQSIQRPAPKASLTESISRRPQSSPAVVSKTASAPANIETAARDSLSSEVTVHMDAAEDDDGATERSGAELVDTEVYTIDDSSSTSSSSTSSSSTSSDETRPMILFQPAVPGRDASGLAVLRPTVRLADHPELEIMPTTPLAGESIPSFSDQYADGRIPLSETYSGPYATAEEAQLKRRLWSGRTAPVRRHRRQSGWLRTRRSGSDVGVGRERLPFALSEIDSTQPLNNFRLRFDAGYNWEFPDRAEFLWAKIGGKGPATTTPVETSLDYQDIRCLLEVAGPRFSLGTEIPIRFIDPKRVGNTAGLGDMSLTTKVMLLDGETWQLTQISRTQLPTGTPGVGRGNGHTSMTQGVIARYKWDEDMLVHSELKLWFPLGGDKDFAGEVLRYGMGFAKLLYDGDDFAVIPTLEFVGWSILSGRYSATGFTDGVRVDNENIFNVYPGVRFVRDTGGDLGLFELGLAGGICITERHWYRGLLRMDLRFSF